MLIFHLCGEQPLANRLQPFSASLVVLPTLSNVQNFRTIGQTIFVQRVPENCMFPWESEVVLNTVLSINALARD
jgi:hypothetical protein